MYANYNNNNKNRQYIFKLYSRVFQLDKPIATTYFYLKYLC